MVNFIRALCLFLASSTSVVLSMTLKDYEAQNILDKGIKALGGKNALNALKGGSMHAYANPESLYRSQTLQESVTLGFPDTAIGTVGSQTISYDLTGGPDSTIQRIDRAYRLGDFWDFGRPNLESVNTSINTRSGNDGYSCYVKGNEGIYTPPFVPGGYTDPSLARILLQDAVRLYPKLLLGFAVTPVLTASEIKFHGIEHPALTDAYLGITRHDIYGNSTNDFVVYNYTSVAGVQFPRRIKLIYNEDNMLIHPLIGRIDVNPSFPSDFFSGIPLSQISNTGLGLPPSPPADTPYGNAAVFESSQNLLWYGGYYGNLSRVTVTHPVPGLPGLIHLVFDDAPGYTTTIAICKYGGRSHGHRCAASPEQAGHSVDQGKSEEEAHPLACDSAPPEVHTLRSDVLQLWFINLTLLALDDHNYGTADYVAAGATLVVPEDYTYYWSKIPGVKFATASATRPFVHHTPSMQVRGVWPGSKDAHANDWMYFTFTPRCPTKDSPMALEIADMWSPVAVGYEFNQLLAISYLAIARRHRMPRENLVIPIHGVPSNATELYALTGYDYPNYNILDFVPGGKWC